MQYKRVCSIDGAEIPYEEIGRGYESATGEIVVLSDDDLATLPATTSRSIEIISFLPLDAVDPIYFDRSYYVEPERVGAKAYRLMRDALRKRGRVAVTKVKLRDREIIGVLRVNGDVLVLATMLWPDEVREPQFPFLCEADEWVAPSAELAMAEALIDSLADEHLDPNRYRDVRRETLTALINAKATGAPTPEVDCRRGIARPLGCVAGQHRGRQATQCQREWRTSAGRRAGQSGEEEGREAAAVGRSNGPPKKRG